MDDESRQLLREIRDLLVRQESTTKRTVVAVSVLVAAVTCAVIFLVIHVTGALSDLEHPPRQAAMAGP